MADENKLIRGLGLELTGLDADVIKANEKLKTLGKNGSENLLKLRVDLDLDKQTIGDIKTIIDYMSKVGTASQDSFDKTASSTKKAAKELNDYQKYLKELIHLYKTQELDSQNFVKMGSELRADKTAWGSLGSREQESLMQTLISAEKQHVSVLKEGKTILDSNNKSVLSASSSWQEYYNKILKIGSISKSAKDSASVFNQEFKEQEIISKRLKLYWEDYDRTILKVGQTSKSAKASASVFNEVFKQQEIIAKQAASYFNSALQARQKTMFGGMDTLGSGDARSGFGQKFMNSIAYGTAYRMQSGFISAMSEGMEIVKQYEVGVNDLRRTLEGVTNKDLKEFGNQAIAFSKDFGIPLQEVQKAMTELARAGILKGDLGGMTETVLMGLNTTEVKDAASMVGYLVSAVKQLRMEMSDSGIIIDSWNKLADKYAVQTDDFATSLQRAGSASRLLGLDLHDVNAMTVILGEATQASGEMIGQALKSLEVRLLRPETVKTLESYGIAIKKNEKEFLTFEEIMSNVNNRIKGLEEGSIELNTIMDAMGGALIFCLVQMFVKSIIILNQYNTKNFTLLTAGMDCWKQSA